MPEMIQIRLFVSNRSRHFWWRDDPVVTMLTMVTVMPNHRRYGWAIKG